MQSRSSLDYVSQPIGWIIVATGVAIGLFVDIYHGYTSLQARDVVVVAIVFFAFIGLSGLLAVYRLGKTFHARSKSGHLVE